MFLTGLLLGLFVGFNFGLFTLMAVRIGAANDTPARFEKWLGRKSREAARDKDEQVTVSRERSDGDL